MSLYQDLIRRGTGIVTGFSKQAVDQTINKICDYYGLLPETKPILVLDYTDKNGVPQSILYVTKDGCAQLSVINNISVWVYKTEYNKELNIYISYARGYRHNENNPKTIGGDIGVEKIMMEGDDLGIDGENAMLRSATKAKRRVILHLSGLGFLDEDSVNNVK